MQKGDTVIVFDCGATNIRAIALNTKGEILAYSSHPNNTQPDPYYPCYRIWDTNEIWNKLCLASQKVTGSIDPSRIAGITVTTFGVDGTLFDRNGKMLYPVISWQCERTRPVMAEIGKYISLTDLYHENGVFPFPFNTINKIIWLKESKPELFDKECMFLFMPSVFAFMLTDEMVNDVTMAGTSMLTTLSSRGFSDRILGRIGLKPDLFGTPVEAGTIIGQVTRKAASETSLPAGIPVVATGHDTQFAVFGSGAKKNQPVLSSGTWEILMVRSEKALTEADQLEAGITTEFDSRPGLFDIGNQWLASGILEWARKTLYSDINEDVYEFMISGAEKVPPGCNGVKVIPGFYEELEDKPGGQIKGLTMQTTRDEIYRAMLEALAEKLREGKKALETAGGFSAEEILCVGGGARNRLWNKLRANAAGIPLKIIHHKETTVLGASFFTHYACGNFSSPEEARSAVDYRTETVEPENQ